MIFKQLELETRYNIYVQTKRILRKYQKGIISGKITPKTISSKILKEDCVKEILDKNFLSVNDFQESYTEYISILIKIQNEGIIKHNTGNNLALNSLHKKQKKIISLKLFLKQYNYILNIPIQYLTEFEIDNILNYIKTGDLPLGCEKIYKYIKPI